MIMLSLNILGGVYHRVLPILPTANSYLGFNSFQTSPSRFGRWLRSITEVHQIWSHRDVKHSDHASALLNTTTMEHFLPYIGDCFLNISFFIAKFITIPPPSFLKYNESIRSIGCCLQFLLESSNLTYLPRFIRISVKK